MGIFSVDVVAKKLLDGLLAFLYICDLGLLVLVSRFLGVVEVGAGAFGR